MKHSRGRAKPRRSGPRKLDASGFMEVAMVPGPWLPRSFLSEHGVLPAVQWHNLQQQSGVTLGEKSLERLMLARQRFWISWSWASKQIDQERLQLVRETLFGIADKARDLSASVFAVLREEQLFADVCDALYHAVGDMHVSHPNGKVLANVIVPMGGLASSARFAAEVIGRPTGRPLAGWQDFIDACAREYRSPTRRPGATLKFTLFVKALVPPGVGVSDEALRKHIEFSLRRQTEKNRPL